jgi:hypothetical protein
MRWDLELHADFIAEFERLTETVQDELLATSRSWKSSALSWVVRESTH